MIDPVPELGNAHVAFALGHVKIGESAGELGASRAREPHRRRIHGGRGGGHGRATSIGPAWRPTSCCRTAVARVRGSSINGFGAESAKVRPCFATSVFPNQA